MSSQADVYTLIYHRQSAWDDRCREYHPSYIDIFVTKNFDEAVEHAMGHQIANIEHSHLMEIEQTLLINGIREDDICDIFHDDTQREAAEEPFLQFKREIARKVQIYKDGTAERERKKAEIASQRAAAAREAQAKATEQRERQLLEELRQKYPSA